MRREFAPQPSLIETTLSMTRQGLSFPGLLALGLCTIGLLTVGSAVSSALRSDDPCAQVEARPASVDLGPDIRICEAVTMEGD